MTAHHLEFRIAYSNEATVRFAFLLFFLHLTAPHSVFAQFNTGQIEGTISDRTGAVIPGVKITAVNAATGVRTEQVSDGRGDYLLPSLPPGDYTIAVDLAGF